MNKYIQQSEEKNLGKLPNWMDCNCVCHGFEADGNECPHCHPEKWDLVSDCCKSEFDPFGFSNDQGLWDEKCLKCGKLCDVHYQKLSTPPHKELCPKCGGDIAIRNPTGHCDHLYYPENVPHKEHGEETTIEIWKLDLERLIWSYHENGRPDGKTGVIGNPKTIREFVENLLLSTQQEAVEKERKRSIRRVIRMIEDFYEDDSVERALLISRIEKLAKDTI